MIKTGWVILIIGILSFIGQAIGSAGITGYSFVFPVLGIVLLIMGHSKQSEN